MINGRSACGATAGMTAWSWTSPSPGATNHAMASITAVPPWLIVTATDSARRLVRSVRTWICTCSKRATERKWQLKVAGRSKAECAAAARSATDAT